MKFGYLVVLVGLAWSAISGLGEETGTSSPTPPREFNNPQGAAICNAQCKEYDKSPLPNYANYSHYDMCFWSCIWHHK